MRVRSILQGMDATSRAQLKKLLPKGLQVPDYTTARYPSALLGILEKGQEYALLGCIAEDMLLRTVENITFDELVKSIYKVQPYTSKESIAKVEKSKTTEPFLDILQKTRQKLDSIVKDELVGETTVAYDAVEGHPDARTPTQLFEMKLTGMLKENWNSFLFQLFAYGALEPAATDLYLVLPLQCEIWHYSLKSWKTRTEYRDLLNQTSKKLQSVTITDVLIGALIRDEFKIGFHIPKLKELKATFAAIEDPSKSYQVFLGAPNNTRMNISDAELATGAALIAKNKYTLFVHSQYIINLCTLASEKDSWNTDLLARNLQYANVLGCKGVVVHVGKSTNQPLHKAIEYMRKNIMKVLEYATPECPLLLETPAGQGTETLTAMSDFITFVNSFEDKRIRICLDTCHVFACGHTPLDYIEKAAEHSDLLKLIHYNDSAAPCGSCVDRHALMGSGHIGMDSMREIAERCGSLGVPMVIE